MTTPVALSVVVVAYDMARELPRTLESLAPAHQRDIDADSYEVIVVDNGSPAAVSESALAPLGPRARLTRLDPASPSPARAANIGIGLAEGELVGLVVDGARIASPGLLAAASRARTLGARVVITPPAYHLGPGRHGDAASTGYDQAVEDRLLAEAGWPDTGDGLFAVSVLANSSGRGWFGPMGESSALFLPRALWDELGGLDEGFALPGGGLVNHDLYRRACSLPDVELIVLLGEGTFHQIHGGAATSRRVERDAMWDDYEARRGERYRPPTIEPLYLGRVPSTAVGHLRDSVAWLERQHRS